MSSHYINTIPDYALLINGPEYIDYSKRYRTVRGTQFFETPADAKASLQYDGVTFKNIPILYDIRTDQVVVQHPTSPRKLSLVREKVSTFTIASHTFVYLTIHDQKDSTAKSGYFDLLYNGRQKLIAQRSKGVKELATRDGLEIEFLEADKLFLIKQGFYYPLNRKKSFLKLFPDNKNGLRKYISTNKLKFSKAVREKSFITLSQYQDEIPEADQK